MPSGSTSYFGASTVCYPSIYVDGDIVRRGGNSAMTEANAGEWTTSVDPNDVVGIEAYPNDAGLPAFASGSDSPCGTVLIWTLGGS